MALSFRKPPKFKRNDYHRLRPKHPWDNRNEFLVTEDVYDATEEELPHGTMLELSRATARNRLHREASHNLNNPSAERTQTKDYQEFLTYQLQPQDTLQGIALKYGCSVSELKRVNHLVQDQDVFALQEIRIPAREHSVLFEIFSQKNTSSNASDNSKTFHVSISQMLQKNKQQEPSLFLQEMDKDIQRMVQQAQTHESSVLEKETALSSPRFQPLVKPYYDGSNWGINWYCLLIVLLVVSVLAPVSYGIYFVTMVHHQNENTPNNTKTSFS